MQNIQNVSFQGKQQILFSQNLYKQVTNGDFIGKARPISLNEVLFNRFHNFEYDMLKDDVVVLCRNESGGKINKINTKTKMDNFLLKMENTLAELGKNAKDKLTVLILGGKANDSRTINCVNEIAEVCDKPNVDLSILTGQKRGTIDKIILSGNSKETKVYFPNIKGAKNASDIESAFDIFEVNNAEVITE